MPAVPTLPGFTSDDYATRMARAAQSAAQAGLSGVLVAPGPDLVWLTGYHPTAITERLTLLVLALDREPALVVPALERPDAEAAPGAAAVSMRGLDRRHRSVPGDRAAAPLHPVGSASPTPPGRCTCSGSSRLRPDSRYQALTDVPADAPGRQGRP